METTEEVTEITFSELKRKVEAKEPMFVLATEDKEVRAYLDNLTNTASYSNVKAYRVNVGWGGMFGATEIGIDIYRSQGLKAPVYRIISEKQETKQDFRNQQEIWEYLASGGKVIVVGPEKVYKDIYYALSDSKFSYFSKETDKFISEACVDEGFIELETWKKYLPEPKWYENIPEQGVLCWVWDDEEEPVIDKIVKYEKASLSHRFTGKNEDWMFARPVKFSDIQHLILNVG